jgi:hypothetical protein
MEILGKGYIRHTVERVMGFACHCCGFEKEREIDEMIIIKGILDLFGFNGRVRKGKEN